MEINATKTHSVDLPRSGSANCAVHGRRESPRATGDHSAAPAGRLHRHPALHTAAPTQSPVWKIASGDEVGDLVYTTTSKRSRASQRRPHHGVLLVISAGKTAAHRAPPFRPARTPIRVLATFGARRRWRPHNLEPTRSWVCLCGRRHNVSGVRTTPRGRHSAPAR
jgi:hypothetical protein